MALLYHHNVFALERYKKGDQHFELMPYMQKEKKGSQEDCTCEEYEHIFSKQKNNSKLLSNSNNI